MAAPNLWSTPSGDNQVSDTYTPNNTITYAGGRWFALSCENSGRSRIELRHGVSPESWTLSDDQPTQPVDYQYGADLNRNTGVVYNDGQWAYLAKYRASDGSYVWRVAYTDTVEGEWFLHEFDATGDYEPTTIAAADGVFAIGGYYTGADPQPAFIAYCATADGTWTFGTATADHGYDLADVSGGSPTRWSLTSLIHDGSQWISAAYGVNIGGFVEEELRYASSITGTWGTATTIPGGFGNAGDVLFAGNGYTLLRTPSGGGYQYTDDLTGTWDFLDLSANLDEWNGAIAYGNGYWVSVGAASGATDIPTIVYAESASPDGTYGTATASWGTAASGAQVRSVAYGDGYFVAGSDYLGEIRYCQVVPPTAPRLLRQRQSPKRTPSRVSWRWV